MRELYASSPTRDSTSPLYKDSIYDYQRVQDNLEKESWFLNPFESSLEGLKRTHQLRYEPLYMNHNFSNTRSKHVSSADFLITGYRGVSLKLYEELKNWNCHAKNKIDRKKIDGQILPRKPNHVWISKPEYVSEADRQYLLDNCDDLIELGFFVTLNEYYRASSLIRGKLIEILDSYLPVEMRVVDMLRPVMRQCNKELSRVMYELNQQMRLHIHLSDTISLHNITHLSDNVSLNSILLHNCNVVYTFTTAIAILHTPVKKLLKSGYDSRGPGPPGIYFN